MRDFLHRFPKSRNEHLVAMAALVLGCALAIHISYAYLTAAVVPVGFASTPAVVKWAETALLAGGVVVLFAMTRRFWVAVTTGGLLYACFILATVQKIRAFEAPVFPYDIFLLSDLLLAWQSFLSVSVPVLVVAVLGVGLTIAAWRFGVVTPVRASVRVLAGASVAAGLALPVYARQHDGMRSWLEQHDLAVQSWLPLKSALDHGLLIELLLDMSETDAPVPAAGYSREAVDRVIDAYDLKRPAAPAPTPPVNVVVFFIEAFVDPGDLGIRTTFDPIPHFRRLLREHSAGWVLSPAMGGGSANAEFELLTGMSMRYFAAGVFPYKHAIHRPVPSLARELRGKGYYTAATHVASLAYYNYRQAYEHLGFDDVTSLWGREGVSKDVAGVYPSDQALVEAIIAQSHRPQPFFIFAFPNSTHHPWNYDGYRSSTLDVLGVAGAEHDALKTYVNALHAADEAIGRLISHFERRERTVILVMGDHLPALELLGGLDRRLPDPGTDEAMRHRKLHQVRAVLWSNFGLPKRDFDLSMNLLPTLLLEAAGIRPGGFFALNDRLRKQAGVFSILVRSKDAAYSFAVPAEHATLGSAYELLQYDALYGERFLDQALADAH